MDIFHINIKGSTKSTEQLWHLYLKLQEILHHVLHDFYEETPNYSQQFDKLIRNIRRCIELCEAGLELKKLCKDFDDFYCIRDIFDDSTVNHHIRHYPQPGAGTNIGLPVNYVQPFYAIDADSKIWREHWSEMLGRYRTRCKKSQKKLLRKMPKELTEENCKVLDEVKARYNPLRSLWLDIVRAGPDGAKLEQNNPKPVRIADRLTRHPDGKVLFGNKLATKPKEYTQEWLVWDLLSKSKKVPRRVSNAQLEAYKRPDGTRIFPSKIDSSITPRLARWNRAFEKFNVTPLHKDGDGVAAYYRS